MGLTGHIPFLVPFAPPGFKLRRQGNLTSGGFLDGAHWAYTCHSHKLTQKIGRGRRVKRRSAWETGRLVAVTALPGRFMP